MRARNEHKASLSFALYVSSLEVNLLVERQMCQKRLKKDFDEHNL